MNPADNKATSKEMDGSTKITSQPDEQSRPRTAKMISIWFFVGCLLTAYGALILFAGITDRGDSGREIAMSHLHAQIWWGIGLLLIGLTYVGRFRPRS